MPATGTPSESGFKRYFCPHCRYDVSATPSNRACPECGVYVGRARTPHLLESSTPDVLARLRQLLLWLAALNLLLPLLYVLLVVQLVFRWGVPSSRFTTGVIVVVVALHYFLTMALMLELGKVLRLPGRKRSGLAFRAIIYARIGPLVGALFWASTELRWGSVDLTTVLWALSILTIAGEFFYQAATQFAIENIAARLQNRRIEKKANDLGGAMLLLTPFAILPPIFVLVVSFVTLIGSLSAARSLLALRRFAPAEAK